MPPGAYRALLAATNMKQRVRKLLEYTWADRLALRGDRAPRTCSSSTRASSSRAATASPTSSRSPGSTRARSTRWRGSSGCPRAIAGRAPTTETFSLPQTPGGVLLRLSVRADGPARLGRATTASRPPSSPPRVGLDAGRGRDRLRGDRPPPAGDRVPARARGRRSTRRAEPCAGSPASSGRTPGQPVDEAALLRMARALRHRGPDGYGIALDARRRPGLHAAGDLRPARRLAADARRTGGLGARLQRRGLQPPRAARRARARAATQFATTSDTEVVLRAARARRARGARPPQRPVRVRLVAARARAG